MGIVFYKKPKLVNPAMIVGWPGIGNIGLTAVDTLRSMLNAELFAEIESWQFFYPRKVVIKSGLLEELEFPANKFYFQKTNNGHFIFFIGDEQPKKQSSEYAEGEDAYRMANLVLDVAEEFGCRRVYTSGAAVALIHHSMKSRVWAVPNTETLIEEVKRYHNTILMSEIEGKGELGFISGLNGLLLGVAKKRGFEGVCLMGEIPIYLKGLPIPYPKASKSVIEVFGEALSIEIDLGKFDELIREVEYRMEEFYKQLPQEVRTQLEKLKQIIYPEHTEIQPMTEKNKKTLWEEIKEFLKKREKGDEGSF